MKTQNRETQTRSQIDFGEDKGRTRQSFKDECDIHQILGKFRQTGFIEHQARSLAEYGFADSITLHEAMNLQQKAYDMFMQLPSVVRKRFDNDPGAFLDFAQDPDNVQEMRELGLITSKEANEVLVARDAATTADVSDTRVGLGESGETEES
jgi:phage internal scaffolding protein